jgi:membrane protein implicated in regulation of membrane protease activity
MEEKKKLMLRMGTSVIILLLFLTVAEFLIGAYVLIWWGAAALIGIALIKAYFVIREYMHIGRLFSSDEEAH